MRAQERGFPIESVDATGPDGLIIERDVLAYKPVAASPLARKLAGLGGISLDGVEGSGARGKVMAPDVRQALAAPSADDTSDCLETVIPMDGMRRGIASTMSGSLSATAQANHSMLVDMSECVRLRERMKKAEIKISFNDIIILCAARALKEHPQVNAVRQEDSIVQKHYVNVGMAVATPRGLLVPVIMDTDKKSLREIAGITAALAERTKKGTITPDELTQGTFTVTNLGMLGVDKFVAILNPPESGILAVGAIKKQPVVLEDDSIAVRPMMWITLTYDHCVIDGAPAASFLGRIKELLEDPILLL
jgi:pyruvate dehydrogenase E2 component (dihydrolipoamide acetyltransferase)